MIKTFTLRADEFPTFTRRMEEINVAKHKLLIVERHLRSLPQTESIKGAYENVLNSLDYLEDESNRLIESMMN